MCMCTKAASSVSELCVFSSGESLRRGTSKGGRGEVWHFLENYGVLAQYTVYSNKNN